MNKFKITSKHVPKKRYFKAIQQKKKLVTSHKDIIS